MLFQRLGVSWDVYISLVGHNYISFLKLILELPFI